MCLTPTKLNLWVFLYCRHFHVVNSEFYSFLWCYLIFENVISVLWEHNLVLVRDLTRALLLLRTIELLNKTILANTKNIVWNNHCSLGINVLRYHGFPISTNLDLNKFVSDISFFLNLAFTQTSYPRDYVPVNN